MRMSKQRVVYVNKLIGTLVGADLSCPSPIYRPLVAFRYSNEKVNHQNSIGKSAPPAGRPQGCAPTMLRSTLPVLSMDQSRATTRVRPYYATKHLASPVHSRGDGLSSPCYHILSSPWVGARPGWGHHHARLPALALALLIAFVLLLFPLPTSAHAASNIGTGRIYGQLLDGTKRNAPVVGQSITLQMAQGDNARDLTSVATDAHGMFSFSGLDTDKTINYALYTLYQGAQYYTDLIDLSTKPVQQMNLTVYDATTSIANIAIVQANVLIDKADAQNGLITISENFFFENLGLTTYVGTLRANGSKPNALRFSLPNNARSLSLSSGFDGYQVIQVDSGFASNVGLPPGTSQFAFSFQVPYTTSSYDFSYTAVYPTVDLSLLVPLNIHASSAGMDSQGPVNTNQRTYQQFKTQKLLAGDQIHVQLEGLPVHQPAPNPSPLNQNTLWVIVALLLMLAIVGVTWFIYRFSRRQAPSTQKQTSHTARRGGASPHPSLRSGEGAEVEAARPASPNAHTSSKDQQERLLQELLDLDTAYEAGKIKQAEYWERRARTKARLRSLMDSDVVEKPASSKKTARSSGKGAP